MEKAGKTGFFTGGFRRVHDSKFGAQVSNLLGYLPRRPLANNIKNIAAELAEEEKTTLLTAIGANGILIHPKKPEKIEGLEFFHLKKSILENDLARSVDHFNTHSGTKLDLIREESDGILTSKIVILKKAPPPIQNDGLIELNKQQQQEKAVLELIALSSQPLTETKIKKVAGKSDDVLPVLKRLLELNLIKETLLADETGGFVKAYHSKEFDISSSDRFMPVMNKEEKIIYYPIELFNQLSSPDRGNIQTIRSLSSKKKINIHTLDLEELISKGRAVYAIDPNTHEQYALYLSAKNKFSKQLKPNVKKEIFDYEAQTILKELERQQPLDKKKKALVLETAETAFKYCSDKYFEDGQSYLEHVLNVAKAVLEIKGDHLTVCAALLHKLEGLDKAAEQEISEKFGEIIKLKRKLERLESIFFLPSEIGKYNIQNHMYMILQTACEGRAFLLFLADKLETIRSFNRIEDKEKRQNLIDEMLILLGPMAEWFDMKDLAEDFYNQAFRFGDKEMYDKIRKEVKEVLWLGWFESNLYIESLRERIASRLEGLGEKARVLARAKGYNSIKEKLTRINYSLVSELKDLLGIKIITPDKIKTLEEAKILVDLCLNEGIANEEKKIFQLLPSDIELKIKAYHIFVKDASGRVIEIQVMSEAEFNTEQKGRYSHWAYKIRKRGVLANQRFDDANFESYKDKWTQDFYGNFDLVLGSISDYIFVTKLEKDERIKTLRLKKGSIAMDFAQTQWEKGLENSFVGVKCGKLKAKDSLTIDPLHLVLVPEDHTLKGGDHLEIATNGGKTITPLQLKNAIKKTKYLNTKMILLKLAKFYERSKKAGEQILINAGFELNNEEFKKKLDNAAREVGLQDRSDFLAALGSDLIEEVNILTVKKLIEAGEAEIYCETLERSGPKKIRIITIDRLGLLAKILEQTKHLNLIGCECEMAEGKGKRRSKIELFFSYPRTDKEKRYYLNAKNNIEAGLAGLLHKEMDPTKISKMNIEIKAKNEPGMFYEIVSALSKLQINIIDTFLPETRTDKTGLIKLTMEVPFEILKNPKKTILEELSKIEGINPKKIKISK